MLLYNVLGLMPNANINDINIAYSKITEKEVSIPSYIVHAYQLLINPDKKNEYDNNYIQREKYDLFNLTLKTQALIENQENTKPQINRTTKNSTQFLFCQKSYSSPIYLQTIDILIFFKKTFLLSDFPSKEKLIKALNIIKKIPALENIRQQLELLIPNYKPGYTNFDEFAPSIIIKLLPHKKLSNENYKAFLHIDLHITRLKNIGTEQALLKIKVLKNIQNKILSKSQYSLDSIIKTVTNYQKDILQKGGFFCEEGASPEIELLSRLTEPDYLNTYKSSRSVFEPLAVYSTPQPKS